MFLLGVVRAFEGLWGATRGIVLLSLDDTIGEVAEPEELLRIIGADAFRVAKAGIELGRRGEPLLGIGVALGDLERPSAIVPIGNVGERGSSEIEARGVGSRVGRPSSGARAAMLQ